MDNLRILSLKEANEYKDHFTHCVSIGNKNCDESQHINGFKGEIKLIKFHDYEFRDDSDEIERMQKQVSKTNDLASKCPQYYHVEEMGDWFKKYIAEDKGDRKLLVHCMAGISRSSAVALQYLLMSNGKNIDEALKVIDKIRSMASPNKLYVEYLDQYLSLDGKLERAVEDRDNRFIGVYHYPINNKGQ